MNKYELALVVNAKVEDEVRNATVEKATEYITRFGGTVTGIDDWGKKRLAYEIQHQTEGFYYLINFEGDSATPVGVESELRIYEPVLRYLVVKK